MARTIATPPPDAQYFAYRAKSTKRATVKPSGPREDGTNGPANRCQETPRADGYNHRGNSTQLASGDETEMPDATANPPRRQRGAQPGNTNARTHGFYSKVTFTDQQRELLDMADEVDDRSIIDMLRVEIFRGIQGGDYDPRALAALVKALWDGERTLHRITGADDKAAMRDALAAVLADVETARRETHG